MKRILEQTFLPAPALFVGLMAAILLTIGSWVIPSAAHAQATEPLITNVAAAPSGTQATITWNTDLAGTSQIMYGTTTAYGLQSNFDTNPVTSHSEVITGLTPGAVYHYQVLSQSGTSSNASPDETFTASGTTTATSTASTTEPVITAVMATPTDTTATVMWNTDQPATSQIMYGTTTSYGATTTLDTNNVMSHSEMISGLTPNTMYHFQVLSQSASSTNMSTDQTFTTNVSGTGTTTASTTAPVVSAVTATPTDTTATIMWTTDQAATSQVAYGTTTAYGATSTLDTNNVTNHIVTITGLTANTMYHYQVWSQNSSAMLGSSTDQMFTTNVSGTGTGTTTATSTASTTPIITGIVVTPTDTTASIMWNTDQAATSQIMYGTTTSYGTMSPLDSSNVMSHTVMLSGLNPNTTYHFQIMSGNGTSTATSSDLMFMTTMSSTTGTGTGTTTSTTTPDLSTLQSEILTLQNLIITLQQEITAWINGNGGSTGTTTPPPSTVPAMVDQNGQTGTAGGTIDFGGHNFGHEETVTISMNGATVGSAHADGGGNFSTGSMTLPTTAGTYIYHFVGQTSGKSANATITVI